MDTFVIRVIIVCCSCIFDRIYLLRGTKQITTVVDEEGKNAGKNVCFARVFTKKRHETHFSYVSHFNLYTTQWKWK